jgi:hypothetical protein
MFDRWYRGAGVIGSSLLVILSSGLPVVASDRSPGYARIERFLKINRAEMVRLQTQPDNPRSQQLNRQLDALCNQRDCAASELYWHKDFTAAQQAARASGKPILSLRLLGNLDEDLSCANSRFFRIALYSNPEIARLLRDRYILHWQSVRPVPKITIDFGDGRKVQQTLTGNSIHYLLDADGHPIDALPGLYAPQAFKRHLTQGAEFIAKYRELPAEQRRATLDKYHQTQLAQLQANWNRDLDKLGIALALPTSIKSLSEPPTDKEGLPTAQEASIIAMSKSLVETPILQLTRAYSRRNEVLKQATDDPLWVKLGALHQEDATLAKNSINLIRRKQPQLASLDANARDKNTDPIVSLTTNFQKAIAIDSIRNEYLLHSQIHQWLMSSRIDYSVESLNAQVYSQLFLTPSSDRWLGLMPRDGYTGIDRDGIISDPAVTSNK